MSAIRRKEWEWRSGAGQGRSLPLGALLSLIEPQAPPEAEEEGQTSSVEPLSPSGFVYII